MKRVVYIWTLEGDVELAKRNFKTAGHILTEIWNEVVLDKFPVVSECVENVSKELVVYDERCVTAHCRISQYLIQIVKCTKWECCGEFRTTWIQLFPYRFLPAPVPLRQLYEGPVVPKVNDAKSSDRFPGHWERIAVDSLVPETKYDDLPYDNYCPSVKTEVNRKVCKKCHIYHPSIAPLKRHQKVCTVERKTKKVTTFDRKTMKSKQWIGMTIFPVIKLTMLHQF